MAFFCIHCGSEIDSKFKACPHCGEPITDFLRRYLETPIDGKYQILARLGVGGMGEVYKVLHLHLNSIRVIKLMRANIAGEAGAHERFLREARLATRIQHPNVATLFDFSTLDDSSRYMVWEYIEGINLHELLEARGPLSPKYAAQLAIQTLYGLDAIHRAGIVHRDISPENLMIAHDDEGGERVKIIDLGIAKQWAEESDNKTKTGMFVGKWKYCSPEHLGMLPEGQRIDGRADLYSFGIVLYEMLTGVPPFQADTPHSYLVMHASEKPRALRDVNPTVTASPELEAIIFRALEKDRNKRFATARDFARAIEQISPSLQDKPGEAAPLPTAIEITEEPTRVIDNQVPTIATVNIAPAPTVATTTYRPSSMRWISTAAVAAAVVVLFGVWRLQQHTAEPTAGPPPAISRPMARLTAAIAPQPVTAATVPLVKAASPSPAKPDIVFGFVAINAFPWGEVTRIRNLTTGKDGSIHVTTPDRVALQPGQYEITFSNPAFENPIVKKVKVKPGEDQIVTAEFADANSAPLPRFEGTSQ